MLVTLLVLLLTGEILCQYITHPLGAISYITNSHFQQAVGYSYIAPTGQTVNVKYATSGIGKPYRAQTSAVSPFGAPRFVFHSVPAALPLAANPRPSQFSVFQPQQEELQRPLFQQDFRPARPAEPRPESLFVPSNRLGPAQSEKQLQAYYDYLKEIAREDAGITTTAAPAPAVPDEYEPESLSYIDVDFPEK